MNTYLQTPPHNKNLEKSILAGCILDTEMLTDATFFIGEHDFYSTEHQKIYSCILDLQKNQEPVDLNTIHLKSQENGMDISAVNISNIINEPIPSNMQFYCEKLRTLTIRRNGIVLSMKYTQELHKEDATIETIDQYQKSILELDCTTGAYKTYTDMKTLIIDGEDRHNELYKSKKNITGIPSGFKYLDQKTCGFQKGDLIIMAGRPSMGKSAIATNMSMNMAKEGFQNIIFSIEMSKAQLYDRMLSSESGIDGMKFRNGYFTKEEWEDRNKAAGRLYGLNIFIEDASSKHTDIYRKLRLAKKQDDIKCGIIDYLQLMEGDTTKKKNYEFGEITRTLKLLAKELNIPLIILAQLNRNLEARNNKKPILSDLKDSGSIEQDADVVLFAYRHEMYIDRHDENGDETLLYIKHKGRAEINIAKQRMGPTGRVPLTFLAETTTFKNYINN